MFAQHKNIHANHVIAIVGAGLSGVAAFCQLVDKLIAEAAEKYQIILFEKNRNQFAAGGPYTTESPVIWTLNNPAAKFRLMANGITMAEWMDAARDKWQRFFQDINEEYPPRALAGMFMRDQYESYKDKAQAHGIVVQEQIEEVTDLDRKHDKWSLTTNRRRRVSVDTLFLCLGHATNSQFAHLTVSRHFYPAGTHVDDLKSIPEDKDVYIIGGQATYVDLALWFAYDKHHTGKIHTVTRNPAVITTKGNTDECDISSINELTNTLKIQYEKNSLSLAQAKSLFWNAYRQAAGHPVDLDHLPGPRDTLAYQLSKYKKFPVSDELIGNVDELRSFVYNFYFSGCYAEFWSKLKDDDRELFKQKLYSLLFACLTGITPLNSQLLLALYDRDLILEKSGLTDIRYDGNKERFILQFSNGDTEEAEYLIDSSGLGYDISKQNTEFPLLSNLVRKGYLVPSRLGGIELSENGQAFDNKHELQPGLFCIGPIAAYCHPVPTPFAAFMAVDAVQKALSAHTVNAKTLIF